MLVDIGTPGDDHPRNHIVAAALASALCFLLPAIAQAQTAANSSDPEWSARTAAAFYSIPDEGDYLQPTIALDRDWLHIETRYNYEDRHSISGFVGWNLAFGDTVTLQLTPMFGAVTGETDAVVPALELDLTWSRLEFYSEGEYVFDLGRKRDRFFYNWSEASLWLTGWLRAGLVTQRTRAYQSDRDIQRGPLAGIAIGMVEAAVYFFNPGADDRVVVTSISVSF